MNTGTRNRTALGIAVVLAVVLAYGGTAQAGPVLGMGPATTLTLEVDTYTGAISLLGADTATDINYYAITSLGESLDPVNWSSLADKDLDGNGPSNGSGNGWEEAGGIGTHALAEGYLLGSSTIGTAASIGLGTGYDIVVDSRDLVFKYNTNTTPSVNGLVRYVTSTTPDFDGDGDSDIDDLDALTAVGNLSVGVPLSPANAKFNLNGDYRIDKSDLDQWLADAATANGLGSPYLKGDANLDADVDIWAFDASGDAQVLSSNLGGPSPDGHDVAAEEAEAIYMPSSGELFLDVGQGISVVGIGSNVMYPGNVDDTSIFGVPVQKDGSTLAYFATGGLAVGEDSVGMVLPAGLTAEDMIFSYTPTGGDTTEVPVTLLSAVWSDGDFNGDGDVDIWAMDGSGDAQLLSANLGAGNDAEAGTAQAIYNYITGEVTFDVGTGVGVIGIQSEGMDHGAVDTGSPLGTPGQNAGNVLAYFSTSGLTAGMTHVGTILPAGLATDDIAFSYTPLGGATTVVPVIIVPIPEPSTLAMLAVVGLIGIFRRRRKA